MCRAPAPHSARAVIRSFLCHRFSLGEGRDRIENSGLDDYFHLQRPAT